MEVKKSYFLTSGNAKIVDPYLITRAANKAVKKGVVPDAESIKQAAKPSLNEFVDSHFVYNAFILYNHYAGLIWSQGFPQKAIQAIRKAISLPIDSSDWMSILLRAKSELNLAVFLSRGINVAESHALLRKLTGNLIELLEKYGAMIVQQRQQASKPLDEVFLEELVMLLCFSLHHEATLECRDKREAYSKCSEVCGQYLDKEHPLCFLVEEELRRLDSIIVEQSPLSLLTTSNEKNGGLAVPVMRLSDDELFTTDEPSVRPVTVPPLPKREESISSRRPVTAPEPSVKERRRKSDILEAEKKYNLKRIRPSCEKLLGYFEHRRDGQENNKDTWKESMECWDKSHFELSRTMQDQEEVRKQRAHLGSKAQAVTKKGVDAEENQKPRKENPFVTWQDYVDSLKPRESIDIPRSKQMMKKKSLEFRGVANQLTSRDHEELRNAKFFGLTPSRPDTADSMMNQSYPTLIQNKLHQLRRMMRRSQKKFLTRHPDCFGESETVDQGTETPPTAGDSIAADLSGLMKDAFKFAKGDGPSRKRRENLITMNRPRRASGARRNTAPRRKLT